jgi:gluconate kinase
LPAGQGDCDRDRLFSTETDDKVMFGIWLLTQHDRSDWLGDLSKAAKAESQ